MFNWDCFLALVMKPSLAFLQFTQDENQPGEAICDIYTKLLTTLEFVHRKICLILKTEFLQTHIGSSCAFESHCNFLNSINVEKSENIFCTKQHGLSHDEGAIHCIILVSNSQSLYFIVYVLHIFALYMQVHAHVCGTWVPCWWSSLGARHLIF